jgi:hypothetical protein
MDIAIISTIGSGVGLLFALSWFWWIIFTVIIIFAIASEANDSDIIWFLFFPLFVIPWVLGTNPFVWIIQNPGLLFANILQYAFLGVAYAFFRWTYLNINEANYIKANYDNLKKQWEESQQVLPRTFEEWLIRCEYITLVSRNKSKVARWVVWWPFSLISFFFSDLIVDFMKKVANIMYTLFGNVFRNIQISVYKMIGLEDIFKNPE